MYVLFPSFPFPSLPSLSTAVHVLTNRINLRSDTTMQDTRVQHSLTPPIPLPWMTMQVLPTRSTSVHATTSACTIADAAPTTSPTTPFEIDRRGWYHHGFGDYPIPLAFAFYHQLKHSSFQTNLDTGLDDDDVEMDNDLELKLTYPKVSPFVYTASKILLPVDKCPPATTTITTTATIRKPKPIGDRPTGKKTNASVPRPTHPSIAYYPSKTTRI